jgi:hypothetical protein
MKGAEARGILDFLSRSESASRSRGISLLQLSAIASICTRAKNAKNRLRLSPIFVFITHSQRAHPVLHNYYKHIRASLLV